MNVNKVTEQNLQLASERLRYQNKQEEIKRLEEHLREEKLRLQRLQPRRSDDPTKGNNVDVSV